ncbi:melanoma-associated antigen 8-like [Muntiacus reevesi]|uniref:melanoma-associated antigen 8-like n=1 Tax=Muntiacus reevesi TaxID=9886 RepID=UPI003306C467
MVHNVPCLTPVCGLIPGIVLVVEMSDLGEAQGPEEAQVLGAEGGEAAPPSAFSPPVSSSAAEALPQEAVNKMVANMVKFLLRKYRAKEPTSDAELLNMVLRDNQQHYPVVFRQAVECLLLVFGVGLRQVDPRKHVYIMVPCLGLTCDAMERGGQGLPKAGLLVVVLSLILQNRDPGPEEEIWGALTKMGVYVGREHSIFGEPRELLTQVWVREGYLEYRQVPDSAPARYEFLWGPRAFAETSKEKFTEYLLRVNQRAFRSFPLPSAEDVREEVGRP